MSNKSWENTLVPLVSDKSSFVGQIEIQGYAKKLYFVHTVGQSDQFFLWVGHIICGCRFTKHVAIFYETNHIVSDKLRFKATQSL